ncbi:MAG: hypothetical protein PHV16_00255 [Candidatus Nanoarchaeia archaeon]|nr:hypothetical protein [Candidatus Nanoarchaeia archaeon]
MLERQTKIKEKRIALNKRGGALGFFIFFILIFFISSYVVDTALLCEVVTNCNNTDIFHISNQTNAHAELNNNSNYVYEVCCNDTTGLDVGTSCAGEYFTLLHLSNQTNAHVELNNESNYNDFSVCISSSDGLFNCSYETSCDNYDTCIASVSGSTNAHVGNCTDYATKICCNITAANTPPTIIANTTKPDNVYTNTDWILNLTVTDPDAGDILTAYTQFYVNGTASGSEHSLVVSDNVNTNVANLSSSGFGKGATLIAEFWAGDATENTTKYNTTEATVLNSLPSAVNLSYPENNDSLFLNRTPKFNWTEAIDEDNDSITYHLHVSLTEEMSDNTINETGITNNYYIQPSELEFATYYWRVRANDSDGYGEWSETWNFTLVPSISLVLREDSINFGAMEILEINDTTNDNPQPLLLENDGNIDVNVSIKSTSLWSSSSAHLNTSYFQFKAANSTEENSFNWEESQTSWADMSDIFKKIIDTLKRNDENDLARIDIRVEVPSDEPPTSKIANITFYGEEQ